MIGSDQGKKIEFTGVLDRFEDNNQAVLLIEGTKQEIIVSRTKLPIESEEGTWFYIKQNNIERFMMDRQLTKRENKKVRDLMKNIKSKHNYYYSLKRNKIKEK